MEMGIKCYCYQTVVITVLLWKRSEKLWIGISGGPQPSGSKKDLFLISKLKQRCGRLWICTAETIKELYGYGR